MTQLPHIAKTTDLLKWVATHSNQPFDPPMVVTLSTGHTDDWEFRAVTEKMEDLRRQNLIMKLKQDPWGSTYWTITQAGTNYLHAFEDSEPPKKEEAGLPEVQITEAMTKKAPALRVFLCHASEDKPTIRNLYLRLKSEGFLPWLDEKDLIAGQDWKYEIRKAVRASDVVLACLSRNSISKSGFVQKELKDALDVADEQPEGSIFIIPLKLEECDVPDRLSRWHWVNYFEDEGHAALIRSLREASGPA